VVSINKVKIFCDDCDKWHTVEFTLTSDLFGVICPKCKGNKTWIGDIEIEDKDDNDIVLGRGGRGTGSIGE
jgi:hypothetical protein